MKAPPEFLIARGMPLASRFALAALFAAWGIAMQLFVNVMLGWICLLAASLVTVMRGKSNELKAMRGAEWRNVTESEIEEARDLIARSKTVDRSGAAFSLASFSGCGLVVLLILGTLVVGAMLGGTIDTGIPTASLMPIAQGGSLSLIFIVDGLLLILPTWLFGRVKTWEPPNLEMRLEQIWFVYSRISKEPVFEFQPSLLVAKSGEGSVPMDCRLMVKIKDSDPNFYGIQVQTTINYVQGRGYPYTYCVLIAKPEFGLIKKAKQIIDMPPAGGFMVGFLGLFADSNARKEAKFARFGEALVELEKEKDVEIAVVRQGTSGQGYHTSPEQAYNVFFAALGLAKRVLEQQS